MRSGTTAATGIVAIRLQDCEQQKHNERTPILPEVCTAEHIPTRAAAGGSRRGEYR